MSGLVALAGPILVLTGVLSDSSKITEAMMQKYIEFYYPTTSGTMYEIAFRWGTYVITTGAGPDEELHKDSKPYRGYITMRAFIREGSAQKGFPIYLITPDGSVWTHEETPDIPAETSRDEVTVEKTKYGTSTETVTIRSGLEPIVGHFKANRKTWKLYGKVERAEGGSVLKLAVPGGGSKEN
jgi:hypothetical protein